MTTKNDIDAVLLASGYKCFKHRSGFLGWSIENLCEASDEWEKVERQAETEHGDAITVDMFTRIDCDVYGNPRYYIAGYLLPNDMQEKDRKSAGLTKYRGKRYGAGYVVQAYSIEGTVLHINKTLGL